MATIAEKTKEFANFIRQNADNECITFVLTINSDGNNYSMDSFNRDDAEWRIGHNATRRNLRGELIGTISAVGVDLSRKPPSWRE